MGAGPEPQPPTLDELLAAAARPAPVAPDAADNALAAFRTARDEGALDLPTRPADDWRSAEPRKRTRWRKAGLGTLVAGVMLGGVAMAAGAIPAPFGETPSSGPHPAPSTAPSDPAQRSATPTPPAGATAGTPSPGAEDGRPPTAKDNRAHCRAYKAANGNGNGNATGNATGKATGNGNATGNAEKQHGQGNGAAMDSAVRQRLEAAAGGTDAVEAYCARLLAGEPPKSSQTKHPSKPEKSSEPESPGNRPADPDKGRPKTHKPAP
ncbi:hypothetical protein ACIQ7Q_31360 [Streptomyces sp. NPDC096176]|uniref:hypothetical protein n=1 Tax=Streptomyces sp. NPDC096176 TaxID=3366079 RepID=UPI003800599C